MDITTKNRSDLKAYFTKHAIPTEANFSELIDAMINHADDGIAKLTGNPLAIQGEGDTQGLIDFYESFDEENPAWCLNQNPRTDPDDPDTAIPGFNISDSEGNTRLYINKGTGKLGIGTIEPAETLSIAGNTQVSGVLKIDGDGDNHIAGNLGIGKTDPDEMLGVEGNTQASGVLKTEGSDSTYITGNLGIGTTGPGEYALKVQHSGADYASIKVASDDAGHLAMEGWESGWKINTKTDGRHLYINREAGDSSDLYLGTQNDEMLIRGSDGYTGIGVTDPDERLEVEGSIRASGVVKTEGSSDSYMTGNLGLGIGSPETTLDVNGDVQVSGDRYQDKKTTASLTSAGWYRMAEISKGNAAGTFEIRWATSGRHGHVRFSVAANYGVDDNAAIHIVSHSAFPSTSGQSGVLGIRLLMKGTYNDMYIDFEFEGYSSGIAFDIYHYSGHGWSLTEPENAVSKIPSGYSDYELSVEVTMAARAGRSDSEFVIDKSGKAGIGTDSPGDRLHIVSTGNGEGLTIANPQPVITLNDTDANAWTLGVTDQHLQLTEESLGEVVCMRYDTGNVGIGITDPGELLHVNGSIKASGILKIGGSGDSYLMSNVGVGVTSPEDTLHIEGAGATDTVVYLEPGEWNSSGDYATLEFGPDEDSYIRGEHSNGMTLYNADRFYFSGGNVGIKDSTPGEMLEVTGNIKASGALEIDGTDDSHFSGNVSLEDNELRNVRALQLKDWDDNTGGSNNKYRLLARDGAFQFYNGGVVVGNYNNSTWSDLSDGTLIVESKMAIGETDHSEKLEVYPDSDEKAVIGRAVIGDMSHSDYAGFSHVDANSSSKYGLLQSSGGNTFLNFASGQYISFRENNSEKMRLKSGGVLVTGGDMTTSSGTISGSKVEGALYWSTADYDSGWFTMSSQAGTSSYKTKYHNLGDYPGRVKVLVKATSGNNSGYIFEGMGCAQTDDDDGAYGGVVFAYNASYVRLWAPDKNNNSNEGRIIFVADGWGGELNTQESTSASVRVLCWK